MFKFLKKEYFTDTNKEELTTDKSPINMILLVSGIVVSLIITLFMLKR